jgi:hypothetical protein
LNRQNSAKRLKLFVYIFDYFINEAEEPELEPMTRIDCAALHKAEESQIFEV